MSVYTVVTGDTFDTISRKVYGVERYARTVQSANPGSAIPLQPGTLLVTPAVPGVPGNLSTSAPSSNPDEVAITIGGDRFRFWTSVRIVRSMDNIDSVTFAAPFDSRNRDQANFFRPLTFQDIKVTVGGAALFTGTLLGPNPVADATAKTVSLDGYSTPGVLQDCTPPASAYPLELEGQTLPDIAANLCGPLGVTPTFLVDGGAAFRTMGPDPTGNVLPLLASLARQRGLIFNSSPDGELTFYTSELSGLPVVSLTALHSPLISVEATFTPQQYYSHVTGITPGIVGVPGESYTVKNPHLTTRVRPHVFSASDVESADIQAAVKAKAGRMFGNAATYNLSVATWRDPQGALWAPGTFLKLTAPDVFLPESTLLLIRSVEYTRAPQGTVARIQAVLPGAFSGDIPEEVPWGS